MRIRRGRPTAAEQEPLLDEAPAAPSKRAPVRAPEATATLRLGTSVVIKGHLTASENLTLHGPFQGEIEVRAHTVTIGRLAHIEAPIVAKGVVVEGTVRGNVTATDLIELRDTARLHGNVAAPRIVMADGAWVCGSLETRPAATADSGPPTNPAGEGRSRSNPTGRSVAARKN